MSRNDRDYLDLGSGHVLYWYCWGPDRSTNLKYRDYPDVERWGASIDHTRPDDGRPCSGFVTFHGLVQDALSDRPKWDVKSWEPLTLSPSVLCSICGDHGWIRGGLWESV
jgi:hypothetical protein